MFFPWQHWTKALVWFDDVDISAFHSCVVVDLWESLSEWHLLMSACVLVCRRENVGVWIRAAKFLATKQITVLGHPAYSPGLVRSDFFLSPEIKEILKWRHIDDIGNNTTAAPKAIPQNQFQNCLEGWTRHWHRCIASQGGYLEGDHCGIQHFYHDEFANFIVRPRIVQDSVLCPQKLDKYRKQVS